MPGEIEFFAFPEDDLADYQQCCEEPDFLSNDNFGEDFLASYENGHGTSFNAIPWFQEALSIRSALPATPLLPCSVLWNTSTDGLDLDDLPGLSNAGSDENPSTTSSPQQAVPDNHGLEDLAFDLLPSPMMLMKPKPAIVDEPLTQSSKGDYRCAHCNSMFTHRYLLNRHIKCHTRPHKCTATGCKWDFTSKKDLVRHERTRHRAAGSRKKGNIDTFFCTFSTCEYSTRGFSRRDNLQRHMGRVHRKAANGKVG